MNTEMAESSSTSITISFSSLRFLSFISHRLPISQLTVVSFLIQKLSRFTLSFFMLLLALLLSHDTSRAIFSYSSYYLLVSFSSPSSSYSYSIPPPPIPLLPPPPIPIPPSPIPNLSPPPIPILPSPPIPIPILPPPIPIPILSPPPSIPILSPPLIPSAAPSASSYPYQGLSFMAFGVTCMVITPRSYPPCYSRSLSFLPFPLFFSSFLPSPRMASDAPPSFVLRKYLSSVLLAFFHIRISSHSTHAPILPFSSPPLPSSYSSSSPYIPFFSREDIQPSFPTDVSVADRTRNRRKQKRKHDQGLQLGD